MIEQTNYFQSPNYYRDKESQPKYNVGDPSGKPFICQINPKGWVPLSCLLFAKDEQDAKDKIRQVIEYAKVDNQNYLDGLTGYWKQNSDYHSDKIKQIEDLMDILEVFPADTTMAFHIGWASNDTLF